MLLNYKRQPSYRPPFPEEHLQEVVRINWFSNVTSQETPPISAPFPIRRVDNVETAFELLHYGSWPNLTLAHRNKLNSHVAARLRDKHVDWNPCAVAFREFFERDVAPQVRRSIELHHLPGDVLKSVAWNIQAYWQEINYRDVKPPSFFSSVFTIYNNGHVPCGCEFSRADERTVVLYC